MIKKNFSAKLVFSATIALNSIFAMAQNAQPDYAKAFSVQVTNSLTRMREGNLIVIAPAELKKVGDDFNPKAFIVLADGVEIPSQYNDRDHDNEGLVTVVDKIAAKSVQLTVRYAPQGIAQHQYTKRTQAELSHKTGGKFVNRAYEGGAFKNVDFLRVPPEHKDHSWFIRYEGPGWESDKVGYRFYLDERDANDVFGKKTAEMVLQNVGQDGFDSYHNMQPWGMDVMKVGKSLGLGTPGMMLAGKANRIDKTDSVTSRITENGVVYSSILTNYYGWKIAGKKMNVQSRLNIHAGTRLTHQQLTVTGNPDLLCTGIVKDKLAKLITHIGDTRHWGYIATYGKQSLNSDELGLVVFFKPGSFESFGEDDASNIVKLKPENGNLDYYFAATWILEPGGIKNENEFVEWLDNTAAELAAPLKVNVVK